MNLGTAVEELGTGRLWCRNALPGPPNKRIGIFTVGRHSTTLATALRRTLSCGCNWPSSLPSCSAQGVHCTHTSTWTPHMQSINVLLARTTGSLCLPARQHLCWWWQHGHAHVNQSQSTSLKLCSSHDPDSAMAAASRAAAPVGGAAGSGAAAWSTEVCRFNPNRGSIYVPPAQIWTRGQGGRSTRWMHKHSSSWAAQASIVGLARCLAAVPAGTAAKVSRYTVDCNADRWLCGRQHASSAHAPARCDQTRLAQDTVGDLEQPVLEASNT
jgi:hypothetical protein